jgi:hypothetical protein
MAAVEAPQAVEAPHGERMVQVSIRFLTDNIAEQGKVVPGHVWARGFLTVQRNDTHGFRTSKGVAFNSLMELPGKLERLLIREGITVHPTQLMAKYTAS